MHFTVTAFFISQLTVMSDDDDVWLLQFIQFIQLICEDVLYWVLPLLLLHFQQCQQQRQQLIITAKLFAHQG